MISDTWELRALQAVLLSSLTRLFISTYSTKMRGAACDDAVAVLYSLTKQERETLTGKQ